MIGPNNWSAGEKVAKIPPTDNVNRRYSRINRIKKKKFNIKTEKQQKNLKTGHCPCRNRDVLNNAKKSSLQISLDYPFKQFHIRSYFMVFTTLSKCRE
jgi:hypothetical protein